MDTDVIKRNTTRSRESCSEHTDDPANATGHVLVPLVAVSCGSDDCIGHTWAAYLADVSNV
ncbi:MAG TPA: hypothetical protein VK789_15830 [Bryobacteraceae bacterium]|jgi:hypothetical protein|nr:hypothetical protein [Bryobacteraceae bacterium]